MGQTIKELAKMDIGSKTIFNNRFVVELCEKVHLHYRNLRINLSLDDFLEMAHGMVQAMNRWQKRGSTEPEEGMHIELCRRKVGQDAFNAGIQVNLNKNLYNKNIDKVFADGADFTEEEYIHFKIRDLRIEMPKDEFKQFAKAIKEADEKL